MAATIWVGGIWHETNTFAADVTTLAAFEANCRASGSALLGLLKGTRTEVGGMIDGAAETGFALCPGMWASATPSGIVAGATYATLKHELLNALNAALPVDGVLLALHGAMVAEGVRDPEGDVIAAVRAVVGEEIPIVVTLDLHANVSPLMAQAADALIGYDTYPHIDPYERGVEAAHMIARLTTERFRPGVVLVKPPLLAAVPTMLTAAPPMSELIALAHAAEAEEPDVLCVSIAAGYPYADVPFAGLSVMVTFKEDVARARAVGERIARLAWARREAFVPTCMSSPVTAAAAVAIAPPGEGPIALIDVGDNIGGGAPGDGTTLLDALMRRHVKGVLAALADAEAVAAAWAVGEGKTLRVQVGGKVDRRHGAPLSVTGRVRRIFDGEFTYKGSYMTGKRVRMGRCAVLECEAEGITLLLSELKTMPFDQEQFRCAGLSPESYNVLILKSAIAWRAAYESIVRMAIEVDTPGVCAADVRTFGYERLRRPLFPLDAGVDAAAMDVTVHVPRPLR